MFAEAAELEIAAGLRVERGRGDHLGADGAEYERNLAAMRVALGDAAFGEAQAKGRAMTLEQAIEYALQSK